MTEGQTDGWTESKFKGGGAGGRLLSSERGPGRKDFPVLSNPSPNALDPTHFREQDHVSTGGSSVPSAIPSFWRGSYWREKKGEGSTAPRTFGRGRGRGEKERRRKPTRTGMKESDNSREETEKVRRTLLDFGKSSKSSPFHFSTSFQYLAPLRSSSPLSLPFLLQPPPPIPNLA